MSETRRNLGLQGLIVASSASKQGGASEDPRKRLAIIDGKSVFYRGYYAMPNLSTKDGTPTGGVFGFAVMALEVIKRLKPDYVCVAWDKPKTNIRSRLKMYPKYKAGRKPPPPDFYEQIPILHDLLDAFGWPLYELDDYEADDIMGALAEQAKKKDIETMLVTSDLDALQLINGHVNVYALKKGLSNIELFRPETFIMKYGIKPEQFLDLKALKGDSSDNIPGVQGIGEKTALELIKEFKTLDGVYDNLELVKETTRKKLEANKDMAYLSKKLAAIWVDAPVKLDLKNLDVSNCDPQRISEVLQKLEFRTLVRQLPEVMDINHTNVQKGEVKNSLKNNIIIQTDNDLDKLGKLTSNNLFVHGIAAGKHGKNLLYFVISDGDHVFTINAAKLGEQKTTEAISSIISSKAIIGYDTKNTLKMLLNLGVDLPKVRHDVQVGAFLLNSLRRDQSISELANEYLSYESPGFNELSPDEVIERATDLISVIKGLFEHQQLELSKLPRLNKLANRVEWPVIPVIARMEYVGIKLDSAHLTRINDQLEDIISDLKQQVYGFADQEFNISSPAQLAEILFTKLNLPTENIKRGKTGFSTAASELDKLRGAHPIVDLISQYREVTKLKNTYVDTLPVMVDEHSRIHTTFNLTMAQTGRLSSNDPNLQNIPVRTDLGRQIRTAFVADRGNLLVSADYSQFELRIAAYLSGDKELMDMFNRDVDVHVATAAQIYGREPEDVTKTMRRDAKVVNFGIMYGLSAHGLVQATGMGYEQAKHFIDKYFELRPKLRAYIESVKEKAKNDGYVENIFGRRRPTPDVHSSNFAVREAAMRAAVNMPFQGTAADIMKMAMIKVQKNLNQLTVDSKQSSVQTTDNRQQNTSSSKLLLQIHDSVIVECKQQDAENVAKLVKETMESVVKLPIKFTVDTAIGKNWGEL